MFKLCSLSLSAPPKHIKAHPFVVTGYIHEPDEDMQQKGGQKTNVPFVITCLREPNSWPTRLAGEPVSRQGTGTVAKNPWGPHSIPGQVHKVQTWYCVCKDNGKSWEWKQFGRPKKVGGVSLTSNCNIQLNGDRFFLDGECNPSHQGYAVTCAIPEGKKRERLTLIIVPQQHFYSSLAMFLEI